MPEPAEPPAYCTRKPAPSSYLGERCHDCGHLLAAHIGVSHCPVCELVDLAEQHRAAVEPVQAEESPKAGDRLHLRSTKYGCITGTFERPMAFVPGLLIKVDHPDIPLDSLVVEAQDETRTVNGSWHWPCDGPDEPAGEPEPNGNGLTVNVTVNGTVLSERDLADVIRRALWSDKLRDLRNPGSHFRR